MCGIVGLIANVGYCSKANDLLIDLSRHRGPDDCQIWRGGHVCLGFNRLAIMDLTLAGRQPMQSVDGRWVLVFNGEIYGHGELRRGLDYPFRGHSDTESILASLVSRGFEETVAKLNGMFALAAWDAKEQKLWLARDFAGIKPLYYGVSEMGMVFASQFNQVYQHPAFRGRLELVPEEIKSFLGLGYMQAPGTVFKDIHQVQPGEMLCYHLPEGKLKTQKFLEYPYRGLTKWRETQECTVDALENTFMEVIQDQLVADVPIAVFLSGGIDSPLVAAYAHRFNPEIVAYTIGVDNPDMDERKEAARYAAAIGMRHEVRVFDASDLLKLVDEHFLRMGEPFGDYSSLPTYLVARIAAQENKVMLSGDGGDELFWGYPRFLNAVWHFHWFQYPVSFRKFWAGGMRRLGKRISYAVNSFSGIEEWILWRQIHQPKEVLNEAFKDVSFPEHLLKAYDLPKGIETKEGFLFYLRWNEFYAHLQRVLTKVDRSAMANSLEVRVPFLDKRTIDLAWRIRPELGIAHETPKLILRRALAKAVGEKNVTTKKKGFGIPIREWLRNELREEVADLLIGSSWLGETLFDVEPMKRAAADFLDKDKGNAWGIWIMYAWQKWARQSGLS